MDAGEHREPERREHDAAPRRAPDPQSGRGTSASSGVSTTYIPVTKPALETLVRSSPSVWRHVAGAEQTRRPAPPRRAARAPSAANAGAGDGASTAEAIAEPDARNGRTRVDRDRVLDLDEGHAPDGRHGDQGEERRGIAADSSQVRRSLLAYDLVADVINVELDAFGRPLRDLRISVTDRCNFRCTYCMPKEVFGHDYRFLDRKELLDFEEITRVARARSSRSASQKLRLTGGEPLVRRDLERLIAMLAELDAELTLTTNASLLPAQGAGAARTRASTGSPSASTRSTTRRSAR